MSSGMSSGRKRGREGVFVLSLYADYASQRDAGVLDRLMLWPQGSLSVVQALAVVDHLARSQQVILEALLKGAKQQEEGGALNENALAPGQPKCGQGAVFDASA